MLSAAPICSSCGGLEGRPQLPPLQTLVNCFANLRGTQCKRANGCWEEVQQDEVREWSCVGAGSDEAWAALAASLEVDIQEQPSMLRSGQLRNFQIKVSREGIHQYCAKWSMLHALTCGNEERYFFSSGTCMSSLAAVHPAAQERERVPVCRVCNGWWLSTTSA